MSHRDRFVMIATCAVFSLVGGFLGSVALRATDAQAGTGKAPGTIRAQRLELVTPKGDVKATLSMSAGTYIPWLKLEAGATNGALQELILEPGTITMREGGINGVKRFEVGGPVGQPYALELFDAQGKVVSSTTF
jgi:hypothetical protein